MVNRKRPIAAAARARNDVLDFERYAFGVAVGVAMPAARSRRSNRLARTGRQGVSGFFVLLNTKTLFIGLPGPYWPHA